MAGTPRRPTRQQQDAQRRRWEQQELNRQLALAADRTTAVNRRVAEITGTLRAALFGDWAPLDFERLKKPAQIVPLDLGADQEPLRPPRWEDYVPIAPGALGRVFGGQSRYERRRSAADRAFEEAMATFEQEETARQHRVTDARARHARRRVDGVRPTNAWCNPCRPTTYRL